MKEDEPVNQCMTEQRERVCREKFPGEDNFQQLPIEEKLTELFASLHYLRRELGVASKRADLLLSHQHDSRGDIVVSVHRAL